MKFLFAFVLVAVVAMAYGLPSAQQVEPENIEPENERSQIFPIEEEVAREKRGYYQSYTYPGAYAYSGGAAYKAPHYNQYRRYPYHYNTPYYG